MPERRIRIIDPGLLATVQDTGRTGFQQFGMPAAGAMDRRSLLYGNAILGNEPADAALECTVLGPSLVFKVPCWFCLTGGTVSATLDDEPIPGWQAIYAPAESVLKTGALTEGTRLYVCVGGGIDVAQVMQSRSTYTAAHIGGLDGRALIEDDVLPLGPCFLPPGALITDSVVPQPEGWAPPAVTGPVVRAIPGPQDDMFTDEALTLFFGSAYEIAPQSDRMGYRLIGPALSHIGSADIVSDGTGFGVVQVPGDGQPIVLMADRQTTGGYAKIATVISADLPLLAQARPGSTVRFEKVSVQHAHELSRDAANEFAVFKRALVEQTRSRRASASRYKVSIKGRVYDVTVEPR